MRTYRDDPDPAARKPPAPVRSSPAIRCPTGDRPPRGYGADQVFEAITDDAGHDGVDVAFEVAGNDAAVEAAMLAARHGGRVVLVGIPDRDSTTFRASVARRKGLTILLVRRMKEVYPRAIDLVRRGRVDVRSLVTATYPLEQVADAMVSAVAREGLKGRSPPVASSTPIAVRTRSGSIRPSGASRHRSALASPGSRPD